MKRRPIPAPDKPRYTHDYDRDLFLGTFHGVNPRSEMPVAMDLYIDSKYFDILTVRCGHRQDEFSCELVHNVASGSETDPWFVAAFDKAYARGLIPAREGATA